MMGCACFPIRLPPSLALALPLSTAYLSFLSIFNPLLIVVPICQQCLLPLQNLLLELKYPCLRFAQIRGVWHGPPSSALIVPKHPSLSSWLGQFRKDSEGGGKTWAAQLVLNLNCEREQLSNHISSASANLPDDSITPLSSVAKTGVYYGFAQVVPPHEDEEGFRPEDLKVLPMVMSLGWNPFYKNKSLTAVSKSLVP